jgi:hypothetical protein
MLARPELRDEENPAPTDLDQILNAVNEVMVLWGKEFG